MIAIMMMTALLGLMPVDQQKTSFEPCVWPNRCAQTTVAQFQPCVWPNRCSAPATMLTQFQPCVWPNTCSQEVSS